MSRISCQSAVQHMSPYFHSGLCTKLLRIAILNCNSLGFDSQVSCQFFFIFSTNSAYDNLPATSLFAGRDLPAGTCISTSFHAVGMVCTVRPPPQPPASSQAPLSYIPSDPQPLLPPPTLYTCTCTLRSPAPHPKLPCSEGGCCRS